MSYRGRIDWEDVSLHGALWFCVLLFVVGIPAMVYQETKARDEFMKECLQERPQYECTAMWRSGRKNTTVVPVIIPR